MARIQKKKTVFRAKKKSDDFSSDVVNKALIATQGEVMETGVHTPVSSDVADQKKKKAPPFWESSGSEQSAVMKLADKYFGSWIQFFREVKFELIKVTWPSKQQTIGSTLVVIVFVFIISLFLGVVDIGLSSLVQLIF